MKAQYDRIFSVEMFEVTNLLIKFHFPIQTVTWRKILFILSRAAYEELQGASQENFRMDETG